MNAVHLVEYQDSDWELDENDARFIADSLAKQIAISRTLSGDRYRLNPRQFVGIVTLPSGRRLESVPKVPIRTLFTMLAVAFDLDAPFRDEVTQLERHDDLFEFIVAHFANLVEERIHLGLYRDYQETEQNLGVIRGRITIAEDVRQNFVLRHRTVCRYAEFTWDVPENQIIRQVVYALSRSPLRSPLRLRLQQLDGMLGDIRPTAWSPSVFDQFVYHRLNDDYRPIHQLCRLLLEGASLSEHQGMIDFRTFMIDMNRLFEAFVTQLLRERAPAGISVSPQARVHLGHDRKVPMAIDLLVRDRGRPVLVADCKYKRRTESAAHGHDVYQVLAYCTDTNVQRGMLIYPAHIGSTQDELIIRHTNVVIRRLALDLNCEGAAFQAECDAFAASVWSWKHHLHASI